MLRARLLRSPRLRSLATSAAPDTYAIGEAISGFTVSQVRHIPEYSVTAVQLHHDASGAEHLHLASASDTNNVFSIGFKTNPPDCTGVPHILEHTTLCGSKTYPVRDPFFKMTNRSLANFMNAMTGHDYTFYPFATTNPKDFANLMDVYLSSVFEPLLAEQDFLQEGWRLEYEDIHNRDSDLVYKGVVYNEMKGQNSNSSYYFYVKYLEAIYPALHNSGGDPQVMTNLKYQDLVDFHHRNYHPSNAKTFTYGNMPLSTHLGRLDAYLAKFNSSQRAADATPKPYVENFDQTVTVPGPIDTMCGKPNDQQYKASVTYKLLPDALDESQRHTIFKWKVLGSLLCDGHNAPFYQEFIEKGYGSDYSANTGVDITTKLFSFTMGLNNLSKAEVDELPTRITQVVTDVVLPAFKQNDQGYCDRVEGILSQIELNFKKHKPEFGLGLLSALIPNWLNGVDPIDALSVEETLSHFKSEWKAKGLALFTELLEENVLASDLPKFTFIMTPEESFGTTLQEQEQQSLKSRVEQLTDKQTDEIYERGLELAEVQSQAQNTDVLPTLTLADIPERGEFYPVSETAVDETTVCTREVDTNGLAYVGAVKDISFLPSKYFKWLPLYSQCLLNLAGTTSTPITELETKIQQLTGGVSFGARIYNNPNDIMASGLQWSVTGMALNEKAPHVFDFWHDILTNTKFNPNDEDVLAKLDTLIRNMAQNQMNTIADRGHSFASGYSSSQLTPQKYLANVTTGLEQVEFIMELNRQLDERGREYLSSEVLHTLQELSEIINNTNPFRYRVVGDASILKSTEPLIAKFDSQMAASYTNAANAVGESFKAEATNTLINMPYQVGYASLATVGKEYTSADGAALQVLSQLLTFKHLHNVIRESNGAYGGGMTYDGLGGIINFYSYRDPNAMKSVEAFEDSFGYILDHPVSAADLQEAKLRIFQSVDAPMNIASQGSSEFYDGITDDMRQQRRHNFLAVNGDDLARVTEKYLVKSKAPIARTIIGDKELVPVPNSWKVEQLGSA